MRIRTLLSACTLVLVVLTTATAITLYRSYEQVQQARVVDRLAADIVRAVFELHVLTSEYLLQATDRPRERWRDQHVALLTLLDALPEDLPEGGTDLLALRRDIEGLGTAFEDLFVGEPILRGFDSAAPADATWGNALVVEFLRVSEATVVAVAVLAQESRATQDAAERQAVTLLLAFVIGTVVLVLAMWLVVTQRVLQRIGLLQDAIRSVERGQLDYRIGLRSDDEIGEVAVAFDAMAAEVERSQKELEQFAYVASHDLQEPLRMVASYTELLGKRYRGNLDDRADKYIGYAVDGAKRMQALINDLLTYSRIGTRGKPFEPTDCGAVVREAIGNLQSSVDESGAQIVQGKLPMLRADRMQLVQVFQNLIANAIRYRSEAPPRIEISAERHATTWTFSVRDNGIGIAPEFLERIFIIFQRLHSRNEADGNGIGLAIVKKIVERHGGQVWVESQPGQGSTFLFTLRAADFGSPTP